MTAGSISRLDARTEAVESYLDVTLDPDGHPGINDEITDTIRRWTPFWARIVPHFGVEYEDGMVRLEWQLDGWDCSMEIDSNGQGFAHRYSSNTDEDAEVELASFDHAFSVADRWTAGTW